MAKYRIVRNDYVATNFPLKGLMVENYYVEKYYDGRMSHATEPSWFKLPDINESNGPFYFSNIAEAEKFIRDYHQMSKDVVIKEIEL